jgi:glycosyltransferase involved in cell wall biosynthesis
MAAALALVPQTAAPLVDAEAADLGTVTLAHDYLNQRGGAERVALEMAQMWPDAPLYTSLYRPDTTFAEFSQFDVRTTFLDRAPVNAGFRNLFPAYPAAFRMLPALASDVVISSSSGWAHMVRTAPESFHAVYCYTPARWLYGGEHLGRSGRRAASRLLMRNFRNADQRAARQADLYIAISSAVQRRIRERYGREAPVVYPPVNVDRFIPSARGERLLVVSRLLPYKRVDAIVAAATRGGIGLDVVGTGPSLDDLRGIAGDTVEFHGQADDAAVTELMQSCRAVCLPGSEDFGLVPVEAQAAGKPVVAFAGGGALETVAEGVSGSFFHSYDPDDILAAIERCDRVGTSPYELAVGARRFAPDRFRAELVSVIQNGLRARAARQSII